MARRARRAPGGLCPSPERRRAVAVPSPGMGNTKITDDPRIDPRIKALFGAFEMSGPLGDVASREDLLAEANTEEALAQRAVLTTFLGMSDTEEIASSAGLAITEHAVVSEPD